MGNRGRKKVWRGVLLFLLIGLLAGVRKNVAEAAARAEDDFDIALTYGYDNTVRYGREAAFHVQVTSNGPAFSGSIHFLTSSYGEEMYYGSNPLFTLPFSGDSYRRRYDNYGATKDLELEPGETGTVTFVLPMTSCAPFVRVQLLDEDGQVQEEKEISLSVRGVSGEFLAGVLTDDPEGMQYLDGMRLSAYSDISLAAVMLNEDTLEDSAGGLDLLDLLLIQDFDRSRLSSTQEAAIRQWIRNGGVLVLCGQENDETSAPEIEHVGDGRIVTYSQRFNRKEGEEAGTEQRIQRLLEDCFYKSVLENTGEVERNGTSYWTISSELEGTSMEHIPRTAGYAVVLAIYVVLAGPVLYLILKRVHGRKYIWGCVGVLAVVFSGIVFVMGSKTRFNAPFIHYVRTISLAPGEKQETVDFSVRAPYNTAYNIYVNRDYTLSPVCESLYYNTFPDVSPDFSKESMHLTYGEAENTISIESGRAFTAKYLKAEKTEQVEESFGIQGELCYYDGILEGTLRNQTAYDLKDVFILFQNHLVYVEQFGSGETLDVGTCKLYEYAPGDGYMVVQECLQYDTGYHKDLDATFLDRSWKNSILNNQLVSGYEQELGVCRMIGFADGEPLDLMKDSAYQTTGQTLVRTDLPLTFQKEKNGERRAYFPFITTTARVVSGDYSAYSNLIYGNDVVLEYQVPEQLTEGTLSFAHENYYDTDAYEEFAGTIEIYNYRTGRYEKISEEEELSGEQLWQYVSLDNRLLIRYRNTAVTGDKSIKLPILIMEGRI